jgi:membrane protease YdiL (CAAX protease family)
LATPHPHTVRAALILAGFAVSEGAWVLVNLFPEPGPLLGYLGFAPGKLGTPLGWALALVVTVGFVVRSARLPSVRANLVRPSWLKLLAILMAIAAGILEEAFFRRMLMNWLQQGGVGVLLQVLASALAFGVAHGIWGLFGRSLRAALGATLATGALGAALALVYVAAGRSVAACVVAHVVIDFFIEPGLILAALRGEMARRPPPGATPRPA